MALFMNPPADMSKQAKKNWKFFAAELDTNALLTKRDRDSFRFLCEEAAIAQQALQEMLQNGSFVLTENDAGHNDRMRRHPLYIIYAQASKSYRQWCHEFGMTPRSRLPLMVNAPRGNSPHPSEGVEDDDIDDNVFHIHRVSK